ncbi:MAG: hypothetical protein M1365_09975, partial [Actinobacteria bacterium]|nr:hypothetical protein [Actinomycetota bacterium]
MNKKCLIHIMGPTNLLAAIVAVETVNNHKNITTDVILESPGFSKKARKEVYQTVKDLSQKMYI